MSKKLFNKDITPACAYCLKGETAVDGVSVFCKRKGIVKSDYACRRFKYDPLRRIPNIPRELEKFSAEDFKIS